MKKFFTLLVVCTTFLCGLNAEVLLKDSFARNVGVLNSGTMQDDMGTNTTNWFTGSGGAKHFQVADTSLTFAGYQTTKAGRAVENDGSSVSVIRAFNSEKSSGSVYLSCIIRMKNPERNKSTSTTIAPILSMGSEKASSKQFGKILYQPSGAGFKVAPGKYSESATYLRWSKELEVNKEYLLVLRYDFVEGTRNDSVLLWINPTKTSEGTPSIIQVKDTSTSTGGAAGTNSRDDATSLGYAWIASGDNCPKDIIVDEVRVATKWADLFEGGGGDEPELGISPASIPASYIYQGDEKTHTINVTGQKLAGDVTISNTNAEVSLSTTKITKAAAEKGADFTVTIKANKVGIQKDTITLTCGTLTKKILVTWYTVAVANCANVKALKDSVNGHYGWSKYVRLTGEAIVTRDTTQTSLSRELYIEDATGAAKITDDNSTLDATNLVGTKIKDFVFINGEAVLGVQPFIAQGKPTIVSTGNEVEPQVVTLATLQANAADYLLELVQVQKVAFTRSDTVFKAGNWEITQDSQTANVKVEMGVGITGYEIPAKANVTGFSLNTSGSVIVPRGIADIVDASPILLKNGSFEEYKETSFMGATTTQFSDWAFSGGFEAWAAEKTDVIEGEAAMKTTAQLKKKADLDQKIDCSNYPSGDQFKLRICYKNLNDSAIVVNSFWEAAPGKEIADDEKNVYQVLPISTVWDTVEIIITKPQYATSFYLRLSMNKGTLALLDNLAFDPYESTDPYFSVMPEKRSYSFTTNINSDTVVAKLTIRQRNLKQPVKLVWSVGTDKTVYSVSKSEVTEAEETVEVKFKSSKTGKFNGALNIMDDESTETSLMNTTISFAATVIDPSKTPEIKVTPMEFDTFRCKAYEQVTDTFYVTSSNCSEYVRCWANEQTGPDSLWGFGISDSYLSKNETDTIILTFAPKKAGNYTARLKVFTTGVDTIFINVAGVAEEGTPTPIVVDWDTTFTWDISKPYAILNEEFNMGDSLRNKTLKVKDWQNVVLRGGDRPWWGFNSDSTKQAKMTSYYSDRTDPQDVETWLVTPALDYKNASPQVFTFDVMSDLCFEGQTAHLQLYFIDPSDPNDIFFQHLAEIDSMIPYGDSELSGKWGTVYVPLNDQPFIPDVFFMAFKFYDENGGKNGATYYVDNVTWGVKEVPTGIINVNANENANRMSDVHKFVYNGKLYILKDGKRYNVLGMMQQE